MCIRDRAKGEGSVIWANQFDNTANYEFHAKTTAKEIYDQLDGKIDGFTCAVGTGGTLAGVSIGLKNKNKSINFLTILNALLSTGVNLKKD